MKIGNRVGPERRRGDVGGGTMRNIDGTSRSLNLLLRVEVVVGQLLSKIVRMKVKLISFVYRGESGG